MISSPILNFCLEKVAMSQKALPAVLPQTACALRPVLPRKVSWQRVVNSIKPINKPTNYTPLHAEHVCGRNKKQGNCYCTPFFYAEHVCGLQQNLSMIMTFHFSFA
jgi:hypothetical protein